MALRNHGRTRIGDTRHARLGDHPGRTPRKQGFDQLPDLALGNRMFVQFAELQFVDRRVTPAFDRKRRAVRVFSTMK